MKRKVNLARTVRTIEKRIAHLDKRLEGDHLKKLGYDREERAALKFALNVIDTLIMENNVFRKMLHIEEEFGDAEDQSEDFEDAN
jgi:hypothetical protein